LVQNNQPEWARLFRIARGLIIDHSPAADYQEVAGFGSALQRTV
jgi:hypothetical protein